MKRKRRIKPYKGRRAGIVKTALVAVLILAAVLTASYFISRAVIRAASQREMVSTEPPYTDNSGTEGDIIAPVSATPSPTEDPNTSLKTVDECKAIFLSHDVISNDEELDRYIESARESGINAIVFNIKDETGMLLYRSEIDYSFIDQVISPDAVDLRSVCKKLEDNGITPIVSISAFKDDTASRKEHDMAVKYASSSGVIWLDRYNRAWLDPYSDMACEYIAQIACEACDMGAKEISLYNVTFPTEGKLNYISYQDGDSTQAKKDAIYDFLYGLKDRVNAKSAKLSLIVDTGDIISYEDISAESGRDYVYHSECTDIISPMLLPGEVAKYGEISIGGYQLSGKDNSVKETISGCLNEMANKLGESDVIIRPYLQCYTETSLGEGNYIEYSANEVAMEIEATESEFKGWILYDPDSDYSEYNI